MTGLSVSLPKFLAVGSPSLYAIYPWAVSCTDRERKTMGRLSKREIMKFCISPLKSELSIKFSVKCVFSRTDMSNVVSCEILVGLSLYRHSVLAVLYHYDGRTGDAVVI